MDSAAITLLGLALAISSLIYLVSNSKGRQVLFNKLRSPSTLPVQEKSGKLQPGNDEFFPPHRREALADLFEQSTEVLGKSLKELSQLPPDYCKLTPDKTVCNNDYFLDHTTATGFTVREIFRLGDFPDYAALSGIPLPSEHKDFNIETALPRPYRPFRWPYFQTMCMFATRNCAFSCELTIDSTDQA